MQECRLSARVAAAVLLWPALAAAANLRAQGELTHDNGGDWMRLPAGPDVNFLQREGGGANPVRAAGGAGARWMLTDGPTPEVVKSGDTGTVVSGDALTAAVSATDTPTVDQDWPLFITATSGVDCTGGSDSTSGVNHALTAAVAANRTLFIPSGCVLGLASPGAGSAAITIPSGARIRCEDSSAGFKALQQRCTGGTYPGAACDSLSECLGSGTCESDFGTAAPGACTASTCFAPGGGSTYTMLRNAGSGTDIQIENCSFWTGQADPYQRCSGGTNAGDPCRQECSTGSFAGFRCETDALCSALSSGSCLRIADCASAGGSCIGAPHSASGPGGINPLDLSTTSNAKLTNVKIRDHIKGDFSVKTKYSAQLTDVDVAGEVTDCTTPIPATPSISGCLGAQAGICCYGAAASLSGTNAQPTVTVTTGISVDSGSTLTRVNGRGSTTAISLNAKSRVASSAVLPNSAFGPGTASAGIAASGPGNLVEGTQLLYLASGATGIAFANASSAALGNTIGGSFATGISLGGSHDNASDNYIEGVSSTGTGILATGTYPVVKGNHIVSVPSNTLQYGIVANTLANNGTYIGNQIRDIHDIGLWLTSSLGTKVMGNTVSLSTARPTSSLAPIHMLLDSRLNQAIITGNYFVGGWRGITAGKAAGGFANTLITSNRFVGLAGASLAMGGPGILFQQNYINQKSGGGPTLVCDATCSNLGALCQQDSDCTSCSASVQRCIPEPVNGFVGSPTAVAGSSHNAWQSNIMFMAQHTATLQCQNGGGTATNVGALCDVELSTCTGGGGTCGGGPPATCSGGSENGNLCCAGTGANTCSARTPTPWLRVLDYATAAAHVDNTIANNLIFGGGTTSDVVGIDFCSSASLGHLNVKRWTISGNEFYAPSATNTWAIRFPTSGIFLDNVISNNNMVGWGADIENNLGTMGSVSFPPITFSLHGDMTTNSTSFVDITDGNAPLQVALKADRAYYFNCEFIFSSSSASVGVGFAVTGPSSPASFSYLTRLPTTSVDSGGGTDTSTEEQGNADDDTPSTSIGVGTPGNKYVAATRGNIVTGPDAGNLTARVKASSAANITVYRGSNCRVEQMP
jgi:hypothetical protein